MMRREMILNSARFCAFSTRSSFLRRVKAGDESAWFEFHEKYVDMIRRIGVRQGLSLQECEDLMVEVMLVFWRKLDDFVYDPGRGRFRSYLGVIARYVSFRILRDNRPLPAPPLPESYPAEVDVAQMEAWRNYLLEKALEELRESVDTVTYEAFYMLFVQGRTIKEVSAVTRKSANALYGIRFRCAKKLKSIIAEYRRLEDAALNSPIRTEKACRTESRKTPRFSE